MIESREGANPDGWRETILQVEELSAAEGQSFRTASKFRSILDRVAARVPLAAAARLTFEVGSPGVPMQVFDVNSVEPDAVNASNPSEVTRIPPCAATSAPVEI